MSTTSLFRRIFPSHLSRHIDDRHHGGYGWFPFIRELRPPYMLPPGYRIANKDFRRNLYTCYPLGIHLIPKYAHRIWIWTFNFRPSATEARLDFEVKVRVEEQLSKIDSNIRKFMDYDRVTPDEPK